MGRPCCVGLEIRQMLYPFVTICKTRLSGWTEPSNSTGTVILPTKSCFLQNFAEIGLFTSLLVESVSNEGGYAQSCVSELSFCLFAFFDII